MATQAAKMSKEETQGGTGSNLPEKITGTFADTRTFLQETRVEMKKVTWPSREDVISTTTVVVATVAFFGIFLAVVDWLVQRGVTYVFKVFGV